MKTKTEENIKPRSVRSGKNERQVSAPQSSHRHLYRSIFGVASLCVSALLLLSMMYTGGMGLFGQIVNNVFLGMFGAAGYLVAIASIYIGGQMITQDNLRILQVKAYCTVAILILLSCFLYIMTSSGIYNPEAVFSTNISDFFDEGKILHGGGVIGGIISVPLMMVFGSAGTTIILAALFVIAVIIISNTTIGMLLERGGEMVLAVKNRLNGKALVRLEPVLAEKKPTRVKAKAKDMPVEIPQLLEELEIHDYNDNKVIDFEDKLSNKQKVKVKQEKENIDERTETEKLPKSQKGGKAVAEVLNLDHTTLRKLEEDYDYPSIELLRTVPDNGKSGSKKELQETALKLEQTLASFGVSAKVLNISKGPTVTRYELSPGSGVKVSKIVGLADDLALNLAASAVRIEAPIPGKAAVGIEIPNAEVSPVYLRDVVESKEYKNYPSNLAFAIGKDISGKTVVGDIGKMPHLLIAGATGSGKSVCINTLITSILYKARPDQVKLLMIDPKVVELGIYNGIPHLLIPVVTDPRKAAGALNWAVQEMVSRYNLFAEKGVRDLKGYNSALEEEGADALLPQVVIIIDELADLMMVAPNDVEDAICRLAQMARAAGMHLVIATQRPSVDVITGIIKANVPSRISFAVSSQIDSRTILDMAGAEKLLGKGDMLYYPVGESKPIRLQGAFVSDKEVEAIVEFIKGQAEASYNVDIIEKLESEGERSDADPGDNDVLLTQAIEMIVETGQASISVIQRRFKVGYARAARLIDQMEARGVVGGFEGSKPRKILVSRQQWEAMKEEG